MSEKCFVSCLLVLACGSMSLGQTKSQTPFGLVPKETEASIFVPNLKSLAKKGDKLYAEAKLRFPLRISQIVETFLISPLGISGVVDRTRPFGLLATSVGSDGRAIVFSPSNFAEVAKRYGVSQQELESGKVIRSRKSPGQRNFVLPSGNPFVLGRDKQMYLIATKLLGKTITQSKSLRTTFTKRQIEFCEDADILLSYNPTKTGFTMIGRGLSRDLKKQAKQEKLPQMKQTLLQSAKLIEAVNLVLARAQVNDGVNVRFSASFDQKSKKAAREFLELLRAGKSPSSVAYLPKGNVLVAQAFRANGVAAAMILPRLGKEFWIGWFSPRGLFSRADLPIFEGVFEEVVGRLQGFRTGLYLTDDPDKGLVSGIAILKPENAQKFLSAMKEIAQIADGSNLKLKKQKTEKGLDVDQLIQDLSSPRYRRRASARLKLQLLGSKAVPYLKKATKSTDPETARVARQMLENIEDRLELARRQFKGQNPLKKIRTTLALIPNVEERLGYQVSVLRLKLANANTMVTKQLVSFLGPEWENIRLAVHENKIVMLVGSDTKLFDQTLRNLKEDNRGLATEKSLARFSKLTKNDRHFELHISAPNLSRLSGRKPRNRTAIVNNPFPLTSGSLGLGTEHLQLDIRVPVEEIRKMGGLYN